MREELSQTRKRRLIRRLIAASRTLAGWEEALRAIAGHPAMAQHHLLLPLLVSTNQALQTRLTELGMGPECWQAPARRPSKTPIKPRSVYEFCLRACRACGRALGMAFRVAYSVADSASTRLLYASMRALEKQIWILEPDHA